MSPRPTLETVRAWVTGTLPAAEREAFAAAMAADRSLSDLVATYADVHAATVHPAPACPVTAETLRLDAAPAPVPVLTLLRRAAPWAAAVLVVAGAAFALPALLPSTPLPKPVESGAVLLRAIRPPTRETPPAPPAILSRYTPATDGRLAFLEDVSEARAAARAAGRPLLLFVSIDSCPICTDMRAHAFREDDVAVAANGFVLVAVSAMDLDPNDPLLQGGRNAWPIFAVEDAEGVRRRVHGFPLADGSPTGTTVAKELKTAYDAVPAGPRSRALPWDDVHALVRALRDADSDLDPAARRAAWTSVSAKDPKGALGDRARALLAQDAKPARDALDAARDLAAREGAAAAADRLEADARRFEGTPYAADLRAVAERARRDGAFPPVVLAR